MQVDGVWVGTVAAGEAGLPEGVRDVVGQRLSRLSDATNDLLRTAAVFGREFDADLVAAVMQVDEDTAVDRLDEAVAAQLVDEVEGSPGRLSFAHALVRQTLLEELSTNKRVRLHRKIAELLDTRAGYADRGARPPLPRGRRLRRRAARDRVRMRSRGRRAQPVRVGRRDSPVRARARGRRHPRRRRPRAAGGDPLVGSRAPSTARAGPRPRTNGRWPRPSSPGRPATRRAWPRRESRTRASWACGPAPPTRSARRSSARDSRRSERIDPTSARGRSRRSPTA